MKKNKIIVLGIFLTIFIVGLGVIISSKSVGPGEFFSSLREMSPRVMSLMALPIIAILFVFGVYLHKRSEDRKWKKAILKTKAKRGN